MTNSGTSDTLNQRSCAGCNGSTTSAEQLHNDGSESHAGLFAPVLQVTETIITTTTFYSPTDKSTSTILGDDNNRVPGTVNKSDQQRNAHDAHPSPRPTQALHIDKGLPRLPSDAIEVASPRVIPGRKQLPLLRKLSRTFLSSSKPASSDIQEPSSPQPGPLMQPEQPHTLSASQLDDETPESYVQRMSHSVNPVEIAGMLAVT
jgi:hypothetical protein